MRTIEQLREQFDLEVALAARLKQASQDQRRGLYAEVYDELYRSTPHHPGVSRQADEDTIAERIQEQFLPIQCYVQPSTHYLEVGAGDCRLALYVASRAEKVTVIEVSKAKPQGRLNAPDNFETAFSDGVEFRIPDEGRATLAYSNQVIEHLHPEDALGQLQDIHRALAPGGVFVCRTPHRYAGPNDVSKHFSQVPCGLHLKEYTIGELAELMRRAGFRRIRQQWTLKGRVLRVPTWPARALEAVLGFVPHVWRRALVRRLPLRVILDLCIEGVK